MKNIFRKSNLVLLFVFLLMLLCSCKKSVTIGTKEIDVSKNYVVFISQSAEKESLDNMRKGFVKEMVQKGFVESVNVTYIYENAKSDRNVAAKIADLAKEKKPDIILTIGEISTTAMIDKVKDIPIVFLGCLYADRIGICDSEGKPLANATGVRDSHLIDETLSHISTNYSNIKKLGIIYDMNNQLSTYDVDYTKFYATGYDIDIFTVGIKKEADIDKAINNIIPKVDALIIETDDMIVKNSEKIIDAFSKAGKPIFARADEVSSDKVIDSVSVDKTIVGKEGASLVNSILKENKKVNEILVETIDFK